MASQSRTATAQLQQPANMWQHRGDLEEGGQTQHEEQAARGGPALWWLVCTLAVASESLQHSWLWNTLQSCPAAPLPPLVICWRPLYSGGLTAAMAFLSG